MPGCPFKNFEDCPEHNKKNGCELWISYTTNSTSTEAQVEGCAFKLTPLLLIQQINNTAVLSSEVNKVGAEVSASRCENVRNGDATRQQLINLATGNPKLVSPDYTSTLKAVE